MEAVEAVLTDTDLHADTLEGVISLVDNSLVQPVDGTGASQRFVMLETIREFGLEQLAAHDEEQGARIRHARWLVDLAREAETQWLRRGHAEWAQRFEEEQGNLRAALSWTLNQDQAFDIASIGVQLASMLNMFWVTRGQLRE